MHLLISYELLFHILSALFVVILLTFYARFYLLFIEILLIFYTVRMSIVDASDFTCFIYRENINILLRFCAIKHLHFTNISCTLP